MTNLINQFPGGYQMLEQLGECGMTTVYRADNTALKRHVTVNATQFNAFVAGQHERLERELRGLDKRLQLHIIRFMND